MAKMETNINVRTDVSLKKDAEKLFNQIGLTLSSAINIFLKTSVRENKIPFELVGDEPNEKTVKAIKESDDAIKNKKAKGFKDMDSFKKSLGL